MTSTKEEKKTLSSLASGWVKPLLAILFLHKYKGDKSYSLLDIVYNSTMQDHMWKSVENYCVAVLRTTGCNKSDGIIEVSLLKVRKCKIVDKYFSNVKPKLHFKKQREKYKCYNKFKPIEELMPEIQEFIGNDRIIGYYYDFDYYKIYEQTGIELNNPFVDIFVPYRRYYEFNYGDWFYCSLENLYKESFREKAKQYNFESSVDRSLAVYELYEHRKDFNRFLAEMRKETHEIHKKDGLV